MMRHFLLTSALLSVLLTATPVWAASTERLLSELPLVTVDPDRYSHDLLSTICGKENVIDISKTIVVGTPTVAVPDAVLKNPSEYSFIMRLDPGEEVGTTDNVYICKKTPAVEKDILGQSNAYSAGGSSSDIISTVVVPIVSNLLYAYARFGILALGYLSSLLTLMLTQNTFVKSTIVQTGWPFLQGIANVGFIIALLAIAFATTIGYEGFSARKLLPRLLLVALLTNFSLVFLGILVDGSRFIMAATVAAVGDKENPHSLTDLSTNLLKSSRVVTSVFSITTDTFNFGSDDVTVDFNRTTGFSPGNDRWDQAIRALTAAFLIWFLVVGFVVITAGLFVRYVALLLLLTVSPLAFLAFAFPGMGGLASKWWHMFIKYLMYGPIAVAVLVLIAVLGPDPGNLAQGASRLHDVAQGILNLTLVVAMCFMAHKFAKEAGTFGAAQITDFATGSLKKAGKAHGVAYKATQGATGLLGKIPVAGVPFRLASSILGAPSRAYKSVTDIGEQYKKSKAKKEKKRQEESWGTRVGMMTYAPEQYKQVKLERQWANEAKAATVATSPALAAIRLKNKAVGSVIKPEQIDRIIEQALMHPSEATDAQLEAVVNNPEIVNNMSAENQTNIQEMLLLRIQDASAPVAMPNNPTPQQIQIADEARRRQEEQRRDLKRFMGDLNRTNNEVERRKREGTKS